MKITYKNKTGVLKTTTGRWAAYYDGYYLGTYRWKWRARRRVRNARLPGCSSAW